MSIDYTNIIRVFINGIVHDCNAVDIQVNEEEKNITINISADNNQISRLIGKDGKVANALREIMSIIGKNNGKFIHIYFKNKE